MNVQSEKSLKPLADERLSHLLKVVNNFNQDSTQAQFNVIDELHADENSHTRILASLLRVDCVRQSFLHMIRGKLKSPDCILPQKTIVHTTSDEVKIFSQYVDAQLVHQDINREESFAIIIENKIKGAIDQDRQLERYVETIKNSYQIKMNRIVIIYLTLKGEKDAPKSSLTAETKNMVHAYVPLSYKDDIIPWLETQLSFPLIAIQKEPYLVSGITQYIHHLRGLINERQNGRDSFVRKLAKEVGKELGNINPYLALSRVNYELGCFVNGDKICEQQNNYTKIILRQRLRRRFYWYFKMVVADDDNGSYIELKNCALAMYNAYEGQPGDLLYVDFFYEHGNVSEYKRMLHTFKLKLDSRDKICHWDDLNYNDQNYTRVFISSEEDLNIVFESLPWGESYLSTGKCMIRMVTRAHENIEVTPRTVEALLKLQEALEYHIENLDEDLAQRFLDPLRNPHYEYRNGWAWQRASWRAYGEAEIQVFPRNSNDAKKLIEYLDSCEEVIPTRRLRWSGRVLFAFPLKDIEYEKWLLRELGNWQLSGKQVLVGIARASDELTANEILHVDVVEELNKHILGWSTDVNSRCTCDKCGSDAMVRYIPPKNIKALPDAVGIYCLFNNKDFVECEVAAWQGTGHDFVIDETMINERQKKDKWHVKVKADAKNPWPAWRGILVDGRETTESEREMGMNWDEKFFEEIRKKPKLKSLVVETIAASILELYELLTV